GELKAPIVIGRDHLDAGSVASPNRETEAMQDGSDAVSDWPLLNALLNTASGATWVSLHHGGGVGMGFSQHAGMVIVADGTPDAGCVFARAAVGLGAQNHGGKTPMKCALAALLLAVSPVAALAHPCDADAIKRGIPLLKLHFESDELENAGVDDTAKQLPPIKA